MRNQHIIDPPSLSEGVLIPLDLPEFRLHRQEWLANRTIRVEVMARTSEAICPHCQTTSRQIHDIRARRKRDLGIGGYRVELIVFKRRFRCTGCRKTFSEPDSACGRRRRTTVRLRDTLGEQACRQPIAHVAARHGVGPRLVQECLETVASRKIEQQGGKLNEQEPLPTPRFLGIDEFARRKGHVYETILCDLEARRALEVSAGRSQEEVIALLGLLSHPDAVEAVSMDMSASFRPAVQHALPNAQIVVDHFHVIQHVMKAFRKVLSSWAHRREGAILLHHKQHLFLLAQETLRPEQQAERARIGSHLPPLETAWQLKEALRRWYATATAATAAQLLDEWVEKVRAFGSDHLCKALSAFVHWRKEILAFFSFCLSSASRMGLSRAKTTARKP